MTGAWDGDGEHSLRRRNHSGPLGPDDPPNSLNDHSVFFQSNEISQQVLAGLQSLLRSWFIVFLFCLVLLSIVLASTAGFGPVISG